MTLAGALGRGDARRSEQRWRITRTARTKSARDLDHSGSHRQGGEQSATARHPLPEGGEQSYEQQIVVKRPALWSLEERNLYRLVTEVESNGAIVDRYETRFGIRTVAFDPQKGFFLNGKPVKLKGTCNHQDHAGVGAALPDAVQYYRIRKLQEMGCNSHTHVA